jgi:hypothetical protein
MRAPFWDVLGIEETTSEGDIRRAYATRLRVTNPEDDADGFKKLREAYEHALGYARYMQMLASGGDSSEGSAGDEIAAGEADDDDADADAEPPPAERVFVVPAAPAAPGVAHTSPETATLDPLEIERRDHDALCQRLASALQESQPLNERVDAFNAVLKSPAMQQLNVFAVTERWMADLLVASRPASNALFEPAITYFKWEDERVGDPNSGAQHVLYLRRSVIGEEAAARLLERLKTKQHEYHNAWKETMRPPSQRGWFNKLVSLRRSGRVIEFLNYISGWDPLIANSLDREAVQWWRKRAPLGRRVSNAVIILIFVAVLSPAVFLAMENRETIGDFLRRDPPRPSSIVAVRPAPPPQPGTLFDRLPANASDSVKRYAARRDCSDTVNRLGQVPLGLETLAASAADVRCKRILEMTPDSLLMRQYAGIIALRLEKPEIAFDHFEAILKASPDDAFALFGKGLVSTLPTDGPGLARPKDMSDALAMNPDVAPYFATFGLTAPDVKPSSRKPRSRMPKFDPVHADTDAEKLENPDELDGQALADHFGVDNSTAGKVVLECAISSTGRATNCHIKSEEPPNVGLGEVGLLAMKDIRYKPPSLDGEPVGGLPLEYTLRYNTKDEPEAQAGQ